MADEYSDILGADTLPIGPKRAGSWSGLSFTVKSAFILSFFLVSYVVLARLWEAFWKWREREYKLSMRRKYGIPDNDHRPFNVAYAAAQLAREQEDQHRAKKRRTVQAPVQVSSSREQRDPMSEQVRQRPASQHSSGHAAFPGSMSTESLYPTGGSSSHLNVYNDHHPSSNRVTFADGYNTSASPLDTHAELAPMSPSTRRVTDRKTLGILKSSNNHHNNDDPRKRAFGADDYEQGDEQMDTKKTRVEGEEFIDGDEEPGWQYDSYGRSSRGSKRVLDGTDVRGWEKRQRKVSADKNIGMEVDEEPDALGDLVNVSPSRGRKRDRAEAGSSFGGDEDDENVGLDEDYDSKLRHRKRRNQRTSDANSARSRKRDRDLEDTGDLSDSNEGSPRITSRRGSKKKGKKSQRRSEDEKGSDVSMDESQLVRSTVKGRRIGEEWTSNGISYKIGPNGQRLRDTLLKKAKQRFVMPEDSVHPDRSAFHDVYVEAWITDEEYQNFAAQGMLYEPPKETETPSPASTTKSTPSVSKGKHLLWESTTTHSSTPPPANPFETARKASDSGPSNALVPRPASSLGLQTVKNGRIASALRGSITSDSMSGPPSPSLTESTSGLSSPRVSRYRQYSKWEKQDLEAKAMSRMREANNKKKEEEERLEREKKAREAQVKIASAPPPPIPTISFTKPPEEQSKPEVPKSTAAPPPFSLGGTSSSSSPSTSPAPKLSFGPTPTPPASTNPAPASADNKPKPPQPSPLSFSFTPSSSSSAVPSSAPSAPSAPSALSFAQPPANKVQEGPKSIGLGFPSASSTTLAPPAATASNTTSAGNSTTAPKFNFGLPAKPAAPPASDSNKESTPSLGSGTAGPNPLFARLSPASSDGHNKPQPTPLQVPQASTTTPSNFSFAKPPAPATASAPAVPLTQTQKQPETHSPNPQANTSAPLKFSFGSFKGPASGSASSQPPNADSSSNTSGSKPTSSQSAFGFPPAKPAEQTGTPSFGGLGTAKPASFGGFGNTSNPSPFGTLATSHANNGPAKDAGEQPKATFGGGNANSGGSVFGAGGAGGAGAQTTSIFGSGTSTGTSAFGTKAPPATGDGTNTNSSSNGVTPSPFGGGAFGAPASSGNNVFGSKAPAAGAASTTATPSPFGGSAFGAAAASGSSIFGSSSTPSKPGEAPKPFGSVGATDKSDNAPKSSFSFGAPAGASTENKTPSTSFFGSGSANKPAGASTGGSGAFSFGGSTTPAASPFGGGSFGGFGATTNTNPNTSSTRPSTFSFGQQSQSK
ncbi:hypothetical protein V5O48_001522 [Marasmius crinis-equi]|uniref:Uncharacterized protein n=1 Tax=Marasmius crinis-equi TaxID=585013 RepID=A0ABR3FYC1_9AGAR